MNTAGQNDPEIGFRCRWCDVAVLESDEDHPPACPERDSTSSEPSTAPQDDGVCEPRTPRGAMS